MITITMDDPRLTNITQLRDFLKGSQKSGFSVEGDPAEKYAFIDQTVDRLDYRRLPRKHKRPALAFLKKLTGYRRSQLFQLVNRAVSGELIRKPYRRTNPHLIYTAADVKLLEKTDELHLRLNGLATKEILRREIEVFDHREYQTIAEVSRSHLYNLRTNPVYRSH